MRVPLESLFVEENETVALVLGSFNNLAESTPRFHSLPTYSDQMLFLKASKFFRHRKVFKSGRDAFIFMILKASLLIFLECVGSSECHVLITLESH